MEPVFEETFFTARRASGNVREIDVTSARVIHLDEISGKAGHRKPNDRGRVRHAQPRCRPKRRALSSALRMLISAISISPSM